MVIKLKKEKEQTFEINIPEEEMLFSTPNLQPSPAIVKLAAWNAVAVGMITHFLGLDSTVSIPLSL